MKGIDMLEIISNVDPKHIKAADAVNKVKKISLLRKISAIAACIALLLCAGVGAYVHNVGAKEYNAAVEFFIYNELSTDGLSHAQVRKIYKDIFSGEFSYEKTAEVIVNSMSTEQIENYENLQGGNDISNAQSLWYYKKYGDVLETIISGKTEYDDSRFSEELKAGASSEAVVYLASIGELSELKVKNYSDFKLYTQQKNETIDIIRNKVAPNRTPDIDLDKIVDTGFMRSYNPKYYAVYLNDVRSEFAYFSDIFCGDSGTFVVYVYYLVPGSVNTAAEAYDNLVTYGSWGESLKELGCSENYIDFSESLFKNGDFTKLIDRRVAEKNINVVSYDDNICFVYDGNSGDMTYMGVLMNNVFVYVSTFSSDYSLEKGLEGTDNIIEKCFNKSTIDEAKKLFDEATK